MPPMTIHCATPVRVVYRNLRCRYAAFMVNVAAPLMVFPFPSMTSAFALFFTSEKGNVMPAYGYCGRKIENPAPDTSNGTYSPWLLLKVTDAGYGEVV